MVFIQKIWKRETVGVQCIDCSQELTEQEIDHLDLGHTQYMTAVTHKFHGYGYHHSPNLLLIFALVLIAGHFMPGMNILDVLVICLNVYAIGFFLYIVLYRDSGYPFLFGNEDLDKVDHDDCGCVAKSKQRQEVKEHKERVEVGVNS